DDVLRAEARERAEQMLDQRIARIAKIGNIRTETVIREGRPAEQIERLITADPAIAILVLAAHTGEGPGPLVTAFVSRSGGASSVPVLITIVPASMSDEQIIGIT